MAADEKLEKWTKEFEIDRNIDSEAIQQGKIARSYFLLGRCPKNATPIQISDFKANVISWKDREDPEEKERREYNEVASYFFRFGELPKGVNQDLALRFLDGVIRPRDKVRYDELLREFLGW